MIVVAMVTIAIAGASMTQLLGRIERMVIRWR
jgi:ABC-type nitrate/sulfonate/bicarbonate transport system permease component